MNKKRELTDNSDGIIAGAVSLTVAVLLVKILGLIYKVPLSHILKDEGMGYFNSAYTVFTFFYMLCSGGVPRAVSIMVTEMNVNGKGSNVKKILSASMKLFFTVGFILTAFLLLFSGLISEAIGNRGAVLSMICISPSILFVALGGVARGYLNGLGRLVPIAVSQVLEGAVKFVFGLLFALIGFRSSFDFPIVSAFTVLGVTLGSLVSTLILLINVKINKPIENIEQNIEHCKSSGLIKRLLLIAAPITLSSAIMGLSSIIDLSLIMKRLVYIGFSETEASALYGNYTTLVVPMLNLILALISPITVAALPMLTSSHVLKKREELAKNTRFLIEITAALSIPCAIGAMFFSEEILNLLFEAHSAKIAAPLLVLIAPSMIFVPLLTMVNTVLEATGHTKSPLVSMSIGALLKLILSYVLIGNVRFGICGAPIGTCAAYGLSLLISSVLMLKLSNLKLSVFNSVWKPLISGFSAVVIAKAMYNSITEGVFSVVKLLISILIAITIYLILSIFLGIIKLNYLQKMSKLPKKIRKS